MPKIDPTIHYKNYTVDNWVSVLEHNCYRGRKVNTIAKALHADDFSKISSWCSRVHFHSEDKKISLNLGKISKCKSTWSLSRLSYWIKTVIFCKNTDKHQAKLKKLADCIVSQLNTQKQQEKKQWKDSGLVADDSVIPRSYRYAFSNPHKNMLLQAHKVKELYKETHYTFIHGQPLSFWVINQFVKELMKLSNPEQDYSLYKFLRYPTALEKQTPKDFDRPGFDDTNYANELLSADGYFFDIRLLESCNYFVSMNTSINAGHDVIIDNIIKDHINNYQKENLTTELKNKVVSLCAEFNKFKKIGNIYAICVPKENFKNSAYTAHAFGKHCKCSSKADRKHMLKTLQDDDVSQISCKIGFPQYRIVTDQLNPNDNRIFLMSPVDRDTKLEYKKQIRILAEEIQALKIS